jgi:hypothetical protein
VDEMAVEVAEAKERLELLEFGGLGPLYNALEFGGIHFDVAI